MMSNTIFKETQKFSGPLMYIVVGVTLMVFALMMYGVYVQEVVGQPFGNNPASSIVLIIAGTIPLLILGLILRTSLNTRLDQNGIWFSFSPFSFFVNKEIDWSEVESYEVRKYKPIREYGGWGIRYGFKNGWAYNMGGDEGLQLHLKNGKRVLIGTQKKEQLKRFLEGINRETIAE